MDEIFDIAQIESGLAQMQQEPCHVNELLTSLVTFFNLEKSLTGKDDILIRLRKSNKDAGFTIYTDSKLRQTLFNLVENALKYTNEGSIEIGYELKDGKVASGSYVRDTGIGFPQEKLDVLFQRFRQVTTV